MLYIAEKFLKSFFLLYDFCKIIVIRSRKSPTLDDNLSSYYRIYSENLRKQTNFSYIYIYVGLKENLIK